MLGSSQCIHCAREPFRLAWGRRAKLNAGDPSNGEAVGGDLPKGHTEQPLGDREDVTAFQVTVYLAF